MRSIMPNIDLPTHVNPFDLARKRARLSGVISLIKFNRISKLLEKPQGEMTVHIEFGVDLQGLYFFNIHCEASLKFKCQRCMQLFDYPLVSQSILTPVASELQQLDLPDGYETVLVEDQSICLHDVVEDELLLGLPLIPKHLDVDCSVKNMASSSDLEYTERLTQNKTNPFDVLATLKQNS